MVKNLKKIGLMEVNEAYQKVLYWFFSFPNTETGLNDLSHNLKISKTTAKKIVNRLSAEEFLNKKIYGKTWRITCNKEHIYNSTAKIAFNLTMVYKAYYGGLRDYILKIVGNAKSIVLFGSYGKGEDTEDSDIDLFIECKKEELSLAEFEKKVNRKIELHFNDNFNSYPKELKNNIINGIVLSGFLEGYK